MMDGIYLLDTQLILRPYTPWGSFVVFLTAGNVQKELKTAKDQKSRCRTCARAWYSPFKRQKAAKGTLRKLASGIKNIISGSR